MPLATASGAHARADRVQPSELGAHRRGAESTELGLHDARPRPRIWPVACLGSRPPPPLTCREPTGITRGRRATIPARPDIPTSPEQSDQALRRLGQSPNLHQPNRGASILSRAAHSSQAAWL